MKEETKAQRLRDNMRKNAAAILDREGLTGHDVARLRIMYEADRFLQALVSPLNIKPIFPEEDLRRVEEIIALHPEEVEAYNKVYRIYLWIENVRKQREIQLTVNFLRHSGRNINTVNIVQPEQALLRRK